MTDKGARILVVDDDRSIRRFLRAALTAHDFTISEAATGEEALAASAQEHPEVIILDLGLPDMDGVEITRRLREWTATPIIILSVRENEKDKIDALDAGADDYLTKPFGVGELLARIRVCLRRSISSSQEPVFESGHLRVDLVRRLVTLDEVEISLTPTEYDILKLLIQHAGKVLTHRQILNQVWGSPYESEQHLLRVNISNLRRKLESEPSQPHYILTEPGVGYRLKMGG
jgi:two-component system KDP operon response regulator KdpE